MFDPDHPKTQEDVIKEFGLDTPEGALFALLMSHVFSPEDKDTGCFHPIPQSCCFNAPREKEANAMTNLTPTQAALHEISVEAYRNGHDEIVLRISKSSYKTIVDVLNKQIALEGGSE